jgi:diadenosine tetraphosphatase ApaH/serine/threonine PP2A family protein phosphatase
MRLALISDVHSNLEALLAVRGELANLAVDRIVCLGDVVGYGASPNDCCAIVRELAEVVVLGNHDAAVSGRVDYSGYYDGARHALDWTVSRLSIENVAWLADLPVEHREGEALGFTHGSPLHPGAYDYLLEEEDVRGLVPEVEAFPEVNFLGHSHLPQVFAVAGGEVHVLAGSRVKLKPGARYFVSVGSVGQPRDGDPRACFAVYDSDTREVEFQRVEYDVAAAARRILDADLFYHFAFRLSRGA